MNALQEGPRLRRYSWLPSRLILGLMLAGGLALLTQTVLRQHQYEDHRLRLAIQAATLASQDIQSTLDAQRHLLDLFMREHADVARAALAPPGAEGAQAQLNRLVQAYFPDSFAHTLADTTGRVLLVDFDGLVGEFCQENIQHFAQTGQQTLVLHPHAVVPHYDLMTRLGEHVFFVSFKPSGLQHILAAHELPGLGLELVRKDSARPEIRAQGGRLHTPPSAIPARAPQTALISMDIPDTGWRISVMPIERARWAPGLWWEVLGAVAGLLAFAAGAQYLLHREGQRRREAEEEAAAMATLGLLDPLTGLPNRRALDEDLKREWLNMERSAEPLSLLMIDLDHFKHFNDTFGHLAGDHCLRTVAQAMRASLRRPRDRIARFGGEEFAILLPNTPCPAAKLLADALHEAVQMAFSPQGEGGPEVTISIGISCAQSGDLESSQALLDLADQALYGAKGAGRNTTVVIPGHL